MQCSQSTNMIIHSHIQYSQTPVLRLYEPTVYCTWRITFPLNYFSVIVVTILSLIQAMLFKSVINV